MISKERILKSIARLRNAINASLIRLNQFPGLVYGSQYPDFRDNAIRNVPYYRARYADRRFEHLSDFVQQFSLIDKDTVMESPEESIADGIIGLQPGSDIAQSCLDLTSGRGVDGVLVCAGTSSNQPIELCGQVTREKGRVVVVGAVRKDIPREDYFKKEISVVISRSYGPGRYEPFYEESGNDYPFGYVRFTEQRNMESVLGLVDQGGLTLRSMSKFMGAAAQRLSETLRKPVSILQI